VSAILSGTVQGVSIGLREPVFLSILGTCACVFFLNDRERERVGVIQSVEVCGCRCVRVETDSVGGKKRVVKVLTYLYVWHCSFTCVTWLIHMCDIAY